MALGEGVVSALDEVFVAGVELGGELSKKISRAFVGAELIALVLGILEIAFMEKFFVC